MHRGVFGMGGSKVVIEAFEGMSCPNFVDQSLPLARFKQEDSRWQNKNDFIVDYTLAISTISIKAYEHTKSAMNASH